MTDFTSRLALPSPELTEAPDGPAQISALTAILDDAAMYDQGAIASRPSAASVPSGSHYFATDSDMKVEFVSDGAAWRALNDPPVPFSALPTGSKRWDGQRIKYNADVSNGVIWELEYQSGATGANKWRFVGGGWLFQEIATEQSTGSASYVNLGTTGPVLTAPLAGDYDIWFGCDLADSAGLGAWMAITSTTLATTDNNAVRNKGTDAVNASRMMRKTGLAVSEVLTAKYRSGSPETGTFSKRFLAIRPTRVI
jgi:hypothetical protein